MDIKKTKIIEGIIAEYERVSECKCHSPEIVHEQLAEAPDWLLEARLEEMKGLTKDWYDNTPPKYKIEVALHEASK